MSNGHFDGKHHGYWPDKDYDGAQVQTRYLTFELSIGKFHFHLKFKLCSLFNTKDPLESLRGPSFANPIKGNIRRQHQAAVVFDLIDVITIYVITEK
jgi:hypothetical protein